MDHCEMRVTIDDDDVMVVAGGRRALFALCAAGQHTAPAPAASADLAGRLGHREPRGSGKPKPSPISSRQANSDLAMRFNERRADDGQKKKKKEKLSARCAALLIWHGRRCRSFFSSIYQSLKVTEGASDAPSSPFTPRLAMCASEVGNRRLSEHIRLWAEADDLSVPRLCASHSRMPAHRCGHNYDQPHLSPFPLLLLSSPVCNASSPHFAGADALG
ncbi:hypothetical protein L1887_48383 [Cichorium endivia]|nr:hypothetical protein L1887_48383 [Cichorium endivia]